MARRLAAAALSLVAMLGFGRLSAADRPQIMTWQINGETRGALVYPPTKTLPGGKAPLVFSFHGHGDTAENYQTTELHLAFPEAIVVYPQGSPSPRDKYPGWQTEKGQDNDRDLRLVDVALASLRQKYAVDDSRIYSVGFSNGANFTYLLWAERPNVFAAFAAVAGRLRPSVQLKEPKPLVHIAGMRDQQIAYADQLAAIETARHVNGVSGKGRSCGDGCTLYESAAGAPVMTWIHAGGHEYPDGTSELITKFFREHAVRGATK
jgi:polyhydroxybutyrate depolymerase